MHCSYPPNVIHTITLKNPWILKGQRGHGHMTTRCSNSYVRSYSSTTLYKYSPDGVTICY